MEAMIRIEQLTKRFPNGRGIFDLAFQVREGEVFGFLGPNGAGKSTTIRILMGFMRPTSGTATIHGMDCFNDAARIHERVGYLPGEIALFDELEGKAFLDLMARMRGLSNQKKRQELIERFELDLSVPIRKMSKGMKQKLAIISTFMHDPEVLILDEPTSGLDPLMQKVFIDLVLEEKQKGKTIFMSSHLFDEIERTCDRIGIIKEGRLITISDIHEMREVQRKVFVVQAGSETDVHTLIQQGFRIRKQEGNTLEIEVQGDLNPLIRALSKVDVRHLESKALSLEEIFMNYYEREGAQ